MGDAVEESGDPAVEISIARRGQNRGHVWKSQAPLARRRQEANHENEERSVMLNRRVVIGREPESNQLGADRRMDQRRLINRGRPLERREEIEPLLVRAIVDHAMQRRPCVAGDGGWFVEIPIKAPERVRRLDLFRFASFTIPQSPPGEDARLTRWEHCALFQADGRVGGESKTQAEIGIAFTMQREVRDAL
ncbi:MAG TPA: hypothetical protein VLV78_06540 [Thermoanaerobaculia bacterium]|nr:hypothetical protein [Thermoanaerobaculia bacterium]